MNSDRDRNQILLKTSVIVLYYLFLVMELRNVLFINFVCYITYPPGIKTSQQRLSVRPSDVAGR